MRPIGPSPLPSRIRFAKREIVRALEALENADPEQLLPGIRVLELEEQVRHLWSEVERWRRRGDVLRDILVATSEDRAERLDEALRVWAATGEKERS